MSLPAKPELDVDDPNWFPVPFDGVEPDLAVTHPDAAAELVTTGPGRKLEEIFAELGVPYREGCGCRLFARRMDAWGVAGCREHFDEIVNRLRKSATRYTSWQHLSAASRALQTGLAFSLNPLDPLPGLVTEAIRRAEAAISLPNSASAVD